MTRYVCTLCTTPTYFNEYKNLIQHIERFHGAFNDKSERGEKRGSLSDSDEDTKKKKFKSGNDMIGYGLKYNLIASDVDSNKDSEESQSENGGEESQSEN